MMQIAASTLFFSKRFSSRRFWFFISTSLLGCIANAIAVNLPFVVPFLIGNIAFLVILLRLGFVWSVISLVLVCMPLNNDIVWFNSVLQLLCIMTFKLDTGHSQRRVLLVYALGIACIYKVLGNGLLVDSSSMFIGTVILNSCVFALCIKTASVLESIAISPTKQKHQSLKLQLTHRIGLYSAVPGAVLIAFILQGAIGLNLSSQLQTYDNQHDVFIAKIQRRVERYISQIELVANLGRANIDRNVLRNLTEQHPEYISSLVTDKNGTIAMFYKADLVDNEVQHSNVADRSYFLQPKKQNKSFVSETFQGRTLGQDQLFAVSAPLYKDGAFDGVIEISIDLATLTNTLIPAEDIALNRILLDSENKKIWGGSQLGLLGYVWTERPILASYHPSLLKQFFFESAKTLELTADNRYIVIRKQLDDLQWSAHYYLETKPLALRYFLYLAIAMLSALLLMNYITVLSGRFIHNYTDTLEQIAKHAHSWNSDTPAKSLSGFQQTALEFEMLSDSISGMQKRVLASRQAMLHSMAEVTSLNNELEDRVKSRTIELEQERDKAKQLATIKTRFLANMSHEIRTPITIIKGFTEELMAETAGEVQNTLKRINQNTLHLQHVINDILDTAKIDEGKMAIVLEPISLAPFLQDIADSTLHMATQKKLQFSCNIGDITQISVLADPFRLQQILLNLLSNAIKFTTEGCISLYAAKVNDTTLTVNVSDQGIGISKQQQEQLFDAFTQADSSTSRDYGGTGLGLYISKKLADAMNISLSLTSEVGKGSIFTLTFNIHSLSAPAIVATLPSNPAAAINTELLTGKLLIVDDVADIRALLASYVKQSGLQVMFADNGQRALEIAMAEMPDIIVMDQQMPEMDGYSAACKLRQLGFTAPIISLSADVFEEEHLRQTTSPYNTTLTKPINKQQLLDTLMTYLKPLTPQQTAQPATTPDTLNNQLADEDEELQNAYLQSLHTVPQELTSLLKAQDNQGIVRLLHKIKGTSACFELTAISNAAGLAQENLKAGTLPEKVCQLFIDALNDALNTAR